MAVLLQSPRSQNSSGELNLHANGLLYSEGDIRILRHMVDSLNLRFKTCDLSRPYYSNLQARVLYVYFSSKTNDLSAVRGDIENNMEFHKLVEKHRSYAVTIDTHRLIVRAGSPGDEYFLEGTPGTGYSRVHDYNYKKNKRSRGKWLYSYSKKSKYNDNFLICRYFVDEFKQQRLPLKYAGLIQYVDCMIDTTASIFSESAKEFTWGDPPQSVFKLVAYIKKKWGKEDLKDRNNMMYNDSLFNYAATQLRNDQTFLYMLNEAVEDCLETGKGGDHFESMVAAVISKQKALELKRNRIVVGQCSQDVSPREHAREIAMLAAETHSWDIFLRSHLNIMNDYFPRVTDGSYAYHTRKTYLKELEALNLNVMDLMLGLTMRAQNMADNHYYGSIWRLGWALTESKDRKAFEAKVYEILKDPELDEFNRGLVFLLYTSYAVRLPDTKEAAAVIAQLKQDEQLFPASLRLSIRELKYEPVQQE